MKPETCPERDTCSRLRMARLTYARLCCRNGEPLEAICARCQEERKLEEQNEIWAAINVDRMVQWN
jgi:hypothetical protein